jgi:hypothetical protein
MEMTVEQKRALAMAKARLRLKGEAPPVAPDTGTQNVDASTVFVDEMLFGLPGKAAAGVNALVRAPFTDKSIGEEYNTIRGQYQNARREYADENPVTNTAASIGGAIMGGATGTAAAGNVIGRVAPRLAQVAQGSYGARMATDAVSGAVQGGLSAYGHDQDIGTGAAIGGVAGGLARPVIDAGSAVVRSVGGLAGIGNQSRADSAVTELLRRSDMSPQQVADDLARAAQDGQPEFMVADSLGNSGQRMLSGIARSPGDMRQTIAETLTRRQAGQGERLVNTLAEGFDAPTTANQARAGLTAARTAAADTNYAAARQGAGAVDPTAAIRAADDFLSPGATSVMSNTTGIADDSIEGAVRRARGYLTDGNSVISDFDAAFRAKRELDAMIERAQPAVQRTLIPIRNALDDSLASASQPYASARDTFRQQSQAIGAVDEGIAAASARTRASDNVGRFQGMRPDQQQAFRQGYADPYIARVESASISPTTNKARMLMTEKTGQEFPAFAAPGRGEVMGDRIAREQRMFETASQALGGSRTADNLADIADVQSFDPTMIGALLTGNFKGAALQGLQKGINTLQGRNSQTRDMIAQALMQSSPTRANAELARAVASGERLTQAQEAIVRALIAGGSTTAPRLQAQ